MAKKGTTLGAGEKAKASSAADRHGPSNKNVVTGARNPGRPTSGGRTAPLKGPHRGGV
jgi:hypothetical protein